MLAFESSMLASYLMVGFLFPVAWASGIAAIISSNSDLTTLGSIITQFPDLLANLDTAGGTFLAPSNDALNAFIASQGGDLSAITQATMLDLVSYHILPLALKNADLAIQGGALAQTRLLAADLANLQGTPNVVFASAFGSTGQESIGDLRIYSGVGESANVTATDIAFDGGFIHVIDKVLNFPRTCTKTAETASLSTLLTALQTTNLTGVVDTTPKFTCFAPTDAAFEKAGIDLTKLSQAQISDALKYHSIVGDVGYSTAFVDGKEYMTLLGKPVTVHKRQGQLFINDVAVQVGNIVMTNGVAHVLSGVLSPPADATTSSSSSRSQFTVTGSVTTTTGSAAAGSNGTSSATSFHRNLANAAVMLTAVVSLWVLLA